MPDGKTIQGLFTSVAPDYNWMNTAMTLGLDGLQRQTLANAVAKTKAREILDMATGSGVMAFAVANIYERKNLPCRITGVDFCAELLAIAQRELGKRKYAHVAIEFRQEDAMSTTLPDSSVEALTMGFGIRNFESRPKTYAEILRVLKPGGNCFILEVSQPRGLFRFLYRHLWAPFVPVLARLIGSNPAAYKHLIDSSRAFPDAEEFAREMIAAGFNEVSFKRLLGGTLALHRGRKG
jgi:demethylmenaquinone methyltransferase/2-methoxy-6-polyprenyl-1,4-benzoquinol methylase